MKEPISWKLNSSVFLPAINLVEIARVRVLSFEERKRKKPGSPDVEVFPLIGKPYLISRKELSSQFRYTNNFRVRANGLSPKQKYVVYRKTNRPVWVLKVPKYIAIDNGNIKANTRTGASGDYIVCLAGQDGEIDLESASVVRAKTFRKMCVIPYAASIMKAMRSRRKMRPQEFLRQRIFHSTEIASSTSSENFSGVASVLQKSGNTENHVRSVPQQRVNIQRPTRVPTQSKPIDPEDGFRQLSQAWRSGASSPQNGQMARPTEPSTRNNGKPSLKFVAQLCNSQGIRVGFVVMQVSGAKKKVSNGTALNLASAGLVSNAEVVSNNPGGDPFLRGNGVRLSDLPIMYV